MAYLLDTGILLRLFDSSDPQHLSIRGAVRRLLRRGERLVTSAQNVAEFWNVSTRPASARGGYGHSVARTRRRVVAIERFCEILTESDASYTYWKSLVTDQNVLGAAVHDARLAAIMTVCGISHLLTLDTGGFQRFGTVQTNTPDQVV
jgi:predicted nucleic acid-binding protein